MLNNHLKLASTSTQPGRRNDALNQQMAHLSQGPPPANNAALNPQQNIKISRKHIRANTSINNYQWHANAIDNQLLSSYASQQKAPTVTSAVGAVGAVKPIRDNVQS